MPGRIRVAMLGRYPRIQGMPAGGPESVGEVLAAGLVASGRADVHFIAGVPGLARVERKTTGTGVQLRYVPLVRRLATSTNFFLDRRRVRRELASISPDIVHVHGTADVYAHAALERGWPSVLTVHGIFFREATYEKGWSALRWKVAAKFERAALRRARHLIFLSRYASSTVVHLIGNTEVRYIDNPADDSFFDLVSREEEGRLLLLALVRKLKGHEFAIRAISKLKSEGRKVTLYCVGDPAETDYLEELKQMIAEDALQDSVILQGHGDRSVVHDHYARCSVVVLPSLVENAPLAVSEGMAVGKPIVATPAGGVPEMIEDGKTGLIVPFSDSDALAQAIARLLDSPDLRESLGAQAKKVAQQRFRKEVAVAKTLAYYDDILSRSS